MWHKMLTYVLCICLVLPFISDEIRAEEYTERYLDIRRENDSNKGTYQVITDDKRVYIGITDLIKLADFDSKHYEVEDNKLLKVTLIKNDDYVGYNQTIIIYPEGGIISSDLYGKKEDIKCIYQENEAYVDLLEIFNYLRIKASIIENELRINIPTYTILDFLIYEYPLVVSNFVSQLDLLENGESKVASGIYDALMIACNNFDAKLFVPGWGTTEIKDEQYTKAIQTLNEEDEIFYGKKSNEFIANELEQKGLDGVLGVGSDLANMMSVGTYMEKASEKLDSYMDLVNWDKSQFSSAMEYKVWEKRGTMLSEILDWTDIAVSAYETYNRANGWMEECSSDLDVLRGLNVNNYADKKNVVRRIKKLANDFRKESVYTAERIVKQISDDMFYMMMEKILTKTNIVGGIADTISWVVNTGVAVARTQGNVAVEMDKAELSYMVTCLINVAVASKIDAQVEYEKLDLRNLNSNQIIEFRNSIRTALKSNLRCWSYIYYLKCDGEWENSQAGEFVEEKINLSITYLTLLRESEQYDYALDENDLNLCTSESIIDILTDISETDIKNAYSNIIKDLELQCGVGTMIAQDYYTGVCFVDLINFNKDGISELLVVYNARYMDEFMERTTYYFEVYGYVDGEAVQLDSGKIFRKDGATECIRLIEYEGQTYLLTGAGDNSRYYNYQLWTGDYGYYLFHGFSGENFGVVKELTWDQDGLGTELTCAIDGITADYEEVQAEKNKWVVEEKCYDFSENGEKIHQIYLNTKKELNTAG